MTLTHPISDAERQKINEPAICVCLPSHISMLQAGELSPASLAGICWSLGPSVTCRNPGAVIVKLGWDGHVAVLGGWPRVGRALELPLDERDLPELFDQPFKMLCDFLQNGAFKLTTE